MFRVERTGRRLGAGLWDVAWFAPEQPRGNARPVSLRYGQVSARLLARIRVVPRKKVFRPENIGRKGYFFAPAADFYILQIFT